MSFLLTFHEIFEHDYICVTCIIVNNFSKTYYNIHGETEDGVLLILTQDLTASPQCTNYKMHSSSINVHYNEGEIN